MRTRRRALVALPIVCLLVMHPARGAVARLERAHRLQRHLHDQGRGFQRSQVMEIVSYLTDVYGPRLTGSPNIKQAADWAVTKLREWGASNPRVENWGTFGRGWVNERFNAQVLTPTPWPIIGMPKAWTPGLAGPITADVDLRAHGVGEGLRHVEGQAEGQDRDAHAHPRGEGTVRGAGQTLHGQGSGRDRAARARAPLPRGAARIRRSSSSHASEWSSW